MSAVDSFSFGARRSRAAGADRQGLDRRAAVHEHVQLSRTGIFHRWHQRRHYHRSLEAFAVARNRPQFVFIYKRSAVSIPEVAKALDVRYVLEGSVRRALSDK